MVLAGEGSFRITIAVGGGNSAPWRGVVATLRAGNCWSGSWLGVAAVRLVFTVSVANASRCFEVRIWYILCLARNDAVRCRFVTSIEVR